MSIEFNDLTIEIKKVYRYRTAMVRGTNFPRSMFNRLQNLLPSHLRDNHQVVVFHMSDRAATNVVAIWFTDFYAIVGEESDIIEGSY